MRQLKMSPVSLLFTTCLLCFVFRTAASQASESGAFYFRVREILVCHNSASGVRNPRSRKVARQRALRLRRRLAAYAKQPAAKRIQSFSDYAQKFSDAVTAKAGGQIAVATRLANLTNELASFVCQHKFGELSPVIESDRGFSVYTHEFVEQRAFEILSLQSPLSQSEFANKHAAWLTALWQQESWQEITVSNDLGIVQQRFRGMVAADLMTPNFQSQFQQQRFVLELDGQLHFCRAIKNQPIIRIEHILLGGDRSKLASQLRAELVGQKLTFSEAWTSHSLDQRRFLLLTPYPSHGLQKLYQQCQGLKPGQISIVNLGANSGIHIVRRLS